MPVVGEYREDELERKNQAFAQKREVLKAVYLGLCELEDEEGARDAVRQRIEANFDQYYTSGCDFCNVCPACPSEFCQWLTLFSWAQ